MIFVMVGTEKFPFDRLARAIDELQASNVLGEEFFIQLGSCTYQPKHARWEKFLSFGDVCKNIENCSAVVTHAGVGSTLVCLQNGKQPILVPRQGRLGEHVDDHQLSFAQRMARGGLVSLVEEVADLRSAIEAARGKSAAALSGAGELTGWLENYWRELPGK